MSLQNPTQSILSRRRRRRRRAHRLRQRKEMVSNDVGDTVRDTAISAFWRRSFTALRFSVFHHLLLNMSYFLPDLHSGWHVDQAILSEENRVVVIRFGSDADSQCMVMDETLSAISEKVSNFAVIYKCDIKEVPDFNKVHTYLNLIACQCSLTCL